MIQISEIINEALKELTTSGNRCSYMPYKMDFALSIIERIGTGIDMRFQLTPEVRDLYKELIRYFHGDPEFHGDLNKGILLMGRTGTGKTLAMRVMKIYQQIDDIKFIFNHKLCRLNYEIITVNDLVSQFIKDSFDGIDQYCHRYVLCIDDIGSESEQVKYYGNTLDVVSYILSERYAKRMLTFGTTNYPIKVLEQKYDDRIVSRMYALFNFIEFNGTDFRKL